MADRPLKILMAVPQYPYPVVGGLEKQAHELARALVARGHRVTAISGKVLPGQGRCEIVDGVVVNRVRWAATRQWRWFTQPVILGRRAWRLVGEADVIHIHVISGFGLFFVALAKIRRRPVMIKLASVGVGGIPGLRAGTLGWLRVAVFSQADAVVAMAAQSMAELATIGFPAGQVFAVVNGIGLLGQPRSAPLLQAAPPLDMALVRFVFVGRLGGEKALLDLVSAGRRLADDPANPPFSITIFGDGPLRGAVAAAVERAGLGKVIILKGKIENVRACLPDFDAFIMPSLREGNSNAVLEAMAAGLPIVSTRVGGTPMQVGTIGQPLLCEPGDVAGLVAIMARVIGDASLRATVGGAMRQRVEQYFDIDRVAERYAAAYRLLADGRRDQISTIADPLVTDPDHSCAE